MKLYVDVDWILELGLGEKMTFYPLEMLCSSNIFSVISQMGYEEGCVYIDFTLTLEGRDIIFDKSSI